VPHATAIVELRSLLRRHGYHVFLQPDRPAGWLITLRGADGGERTPIQARAQTRDEALDIAERLFVSHRLGELDSAIREAGLAAPVWAGDGQAERLEVLAAYAGEHGLVA
jgi:hypothetical protein